MADRIRFRRDSAANWTLYNPLLAEGELGYELDTIRFKIGDGVLNWNDLPYANTGDTNNLFNKVTDDSDDITEGASNRFFNQGAIDDTIEYIGEQTDDPHGFVNQTDSSFTFTDGTRTFEITPIGSYDYYIDGIKTTIDEVKSIQISDTEGMHFIVMDTSGVIQETMSINAVFNNGFVLVAAIYWDATNNTAFYVSDERHSTRFPKAVWIYNHLTFGTVHRSGMALSNFVTGDGSLASHAQFLINEGALSDEDLNHTLNQQNSWQILYKEGISGYWRATALTSFGVRTTGTGRAAYNQFTGATWQQAEVTNNGFVLAHVIATNNSLEGKKYFVIQGQSQYTLLASAHVGANNEVSELVTSGLPFAEFVFVGTVIYKTSNTYANAVKSATVLTDEGDFYANFIGSSFTTTSAPSAHGNLSGLGNDDHMQYAFSTALSAGFTTSSAYTDNADGTITLPTETCNFFPNTNRTGRLAQFSITGTTKSDLVDGSINYIVGNYNSGAPVYTTIQDVSLINESTIVPYLTIFRDGSNLHVLGWDKLGSGLSNSLHQRLVKTNRFERESGLILGETGTRNITITAGVVWNGGNSNSLGAIDTSGSETFDLYYHVAGVWTKLANQTQYNNTQYDNGTSLVALSNNKYAVNWVYRCIEADNHFFVLLGMGDYSLAEAIDASAPSTPPAIVAGLGLLVGRIIVEKDINTASLIQSSFAVTFSSASAQVHNDLGGLQGGTAGEYYHLTTEQHGKATRGYSTKNSSYSVQATDKFIFVDASLGAVDITLGAASSFAGYDFHIKLIDATNTGRIIGTIDNRTNYTLTLNESVQIFSDGSNWWII